ncbi:MAG: hypothetical protein WCN92_12260 [Eubacteriales bacterium]
MKKYYVTLRLELFGYCLITYAPDEQTLKKLLNKRYGKCWSAIFEKEPNAQIIGLPITAEPAKQH